MVDFNFTPFPIITTDRLVLRQLELSDDQDVFTHRNDETVNTYLDDFRQGSIEETQAFINRIHREVAINKTILWTVTLKDKNKFMGTICLWNISKEKDKAEIGYTMHPEFQGLGYMGEAMEKILEFAFDLMKLKTIEAFTHKDNARSVQLLLRFNFKQDNTLIPVNKNNRIGFSLSNETE